MASPLFKKLLIKPGHRVLVLNAPDGYLDLVGPLPAGATVSPTARGEFDGVHLFVKSVADLEKNAGRAIKALKPDALFWVAYPKKTSGVETDISRDMGWDALHRESFDGVAIVAIDNVWSALRFRKANG